ncbi:hypothetical protein BH11MYX3_BH11MYX3_02350 [soil metagenome]
MMNAELIGTINVSLPRRRFLEKLEPMTNAALPPMPRTSPVPRMPFTTPHAFRSANKVSLELRGAALADVLRIFATACDANIVLPGFIKASVTLDLKEVPCGDAMEMLLEAYGLWYRYEPAGKLLSILPRSEIDQADDATRVRIMNGSPASPALPTGEPVDMDFTAVPLRAAITMLAARGNVNVVMPDTITGQVTVYLSKVPWDVGMRAVLETHGLGFRYRDNGRMLRVASQRELDAEDDAARVREQR